MVRASTARSCSSPRITHSPGASWKITKRRRLVGMPPCDANDRPMTWSHEVTRGNVLTVLAPAQLSGLATEGLTRFLPNNLSHDARLTTLSIARRFSSRIGAGAPHGAGHLRGRTTEAVEQVDEPGALPAIPAGAAAEVEALGVARRRRRRIVRLVFEHQRFTDAEIDAGVDAGLDPRTQAIGKQMRAAPVHAACGVGPHEAIAGDVEGPRRGGGRARRHEARHPASVGQDVRFLAVAVEGVIDRVVDIVLVPAPALEPPRVAVLRPAHLLAPAIDDLILAVAAAARPQARVADHVVEDVDPALVRGRHGRGGHRRGGAAGEESEAEGAGGEFASRQVTGRRTHRGQYNINDRIRQCIDRRNAGDAPGRQPTPGEAVKARSLRAATETSVDFDNP